MTDDMKQPTAPVDETPQDELPTAGQAVIPAADAADSASESAPESDVAPTPPAANEVAPTPPAARERRTPSFRGRGMMGRGGQGRGRRGPPGKSSDVPSESDYEEKNLEIARVTRVTKGGKRMRFRALTVIGNRKGRVGFGLAKGLDVAGATGKATTQARKGLITVSFVNGTIPHPVEAKFGAAKVLLKPAPKGTGIRAGGAVRVVLELAGVPNVVSKILGSANKINNVKATFLALKQLRAPEKNEAGHTKQEAEGTEI